MSLLFKHAVTVFKQEKCTHLNSYIVRCSHRKPRYIPKSKSKIFYVRKPTPKDPEEAVELLHRYRHYRTNIKSIHSFLKTWQEKIDETVDNVEHNVEAEAAEQARLMAINDEWNQQVALVREARLTEEESSHREMLDKTLEDAESARLMRADEARRRVVQESSQPFIREEDLDQEIEKVTATLTDYNFSIDPSGRIYSSDKGGLN